MGPSAADCRCPSNEGGTTPVYASASQSLVCAAYIYPKVIPRTSKPSPFLPLLYHFDTTITFTQRFFNSLPTKTLPMRAFLILATLFLAAAANDCPVYIPNDNDILVMDAEQRGPGGGWEFKGDLPGYEGSGYLSYKPYSNIEWAEAKPQNMNDERIKTYWFKVKTPGHYRVLIKSAAPHVTEHNDIFMSLPESGAIMRRSGETKDLSWPVDPNTDWGAWVDPSHWFKVYQNRGGNVWHHGGVTVDHEGYSIVTRYLPADGTWYSVRMCGRSTQFNVDRIYLYPCDLDGSDCYSHSGLFWEATKNSGPGQSQCEFPPLDM